MPQNISPYQSSSSKGGMSKGKCRGKTPARLRLSSKKHRPKTGGRTAAVKGGVGTDSLPSKVSAGKNPPKAVRGGYDRVSGHYGRRGKKR